MNKMFNDDRLRSVFLMTLCCLLGFLIPSSTSAQKKKKPLIFKSETDVRLLP